MSRLGDRLETITHDAGVRHIHELGRRFMFDAYAAYTADNRRAVLQTVLRQDADKFADTLAAYYSALANKERAKAFEMRRELGDLFLRRAEDLTYAEIKIWFATRRAEQGPFDLFDSQHQGAE